MKRIKTTIFFSLLGILTISPVFAAMQYPEIAGITISSATTAADFVVYFFNLAIAVGAFIAGGVLFAAGIEYVSARGEPAKIESARSKIKNAFLGLIILLASFMILNTINSQLTNVKISQLEKAPDTEELVVPEGSGVYLYDSTNYTLGEIKEPVRVIETKPAFIESNFVNKAESIKFNNPTGGFKFGAVLFAAKENSDEGSGANLRGNCSYILSDIPDLSVANGEENNPPIGKDKLSSIFIFKTMGESPDIKIFNTINCHDRTDEYGPTCKDKDDCLITGSSGFKNLKDVCKKFVGDIVSVKVSANTGILFKSTDANQPGRCQFIESNTSACINLVKYSYVFKMNNENYWSIFTPKSFVVFSLAK